MMPRKPLTTFLAKRFWSERSLFKLHASPSLLETLLPEQITPLSQPAVVKAGSEDLAGAVGEVVVVVADLAVVVVLYVASFICKESTLTLSRLLVRMARLQKLAQMARLFL